MIFRGSYWHIQWYERSASGIRPNQNNITVTVVVAAIVRVTADFNGIAFKPKSSLAAGFSYSSETPSGLPIARGRVGHVCCLWKNLVAAGQDLTFKVL